MKSTIRIAAAGVLALALAACGSKSKPDPYLQNVPEAAAVTLDTGNAAAVSGAVAGIDPVPDTTVGDDLGVVHAKAEAMNAALRSVFAHLDAVTSTGGQVLPGNVKQWGPVDRCVEPDGSGGCVANGTANLRLRVRKWTDHIADFVLDARAVGSTDASAFEPVLAGYLIRGATDRRGAGKIWVNFPNLHDAASGFKGEGYLGAGFAAGPVAKAVTYRMYQFTRDPALHRPVTASFTAWKNDLGTVRARVAGIGDTTGNGDLYNPDGTATSLPEVGLWHGVWSPTYGGRAFTVIAGGDVARIAPGKYWFARACYPSGAVMPSYKEWFECDAGTSPAACILAAPIVAGSHQGTIDPEVTTSFTHWSDTTCWWNAAAHGGAVEPDEVAPPQAVPGDQNDVTPEDGDHTGLLPEPCPTTVNVAAPDTTPPGMTGTGM